MEVVAPVDATTLLSKIEQHIHPGTIVWSDIWAACNGVQHPTPVAQHQTVNHTIEFVDSVTSIYTRTYSHIGTVFRGKLSMWKAATTSCSVPTLMSSSVWLEHHGTTALCSLYQDVGLLYPVWSTTLEDTWFFQLIISRTLGRPSNEYHVVSMFTFRTLLPSGIAWHALIVRRVIE